LRLKAAISALCLPCSMTPGVMSRRSSSGRWRHVDHELGLTLDCPDGSYIGTVEGPVARTTGVTFSARYRAEVSEPTDAIRIYRAREPAESATQPLALAADLDAAGWKTSLVITEQSPTTVVSTVELTDSEGKSMGEFAPSHLPKSPLAAADTAAHADKD
jgi:hypothetical protein